MNPRTFTDRDGSELTVSECCDDDLNPDCVHVTVEGKSTCLQVADLPQVAAALYEAASRPAPVILERPEPRKVLVPAADGGETVHIVPGCPEGSPGVALSLSCPVRLVGDEARRITVALVDAMREAETEPDPAEVEKVVKKIGTEVGGAWVGRDLMIARAAARVALRQVREREAKP